jgi:dihydropteroate synthase
MDIQSQGCFDMEKRPFPQIMGIINVTPDSFSDGGRFSTFQSAIDRAFEMIQEGVDIIDIGGESTRPGSLPVSVHEEISRVIPVIEAIKNNKESTRISIDTTKYAVAKLALEAGADIINDISGLESDLRLADLASTYNKGLILMHMQKNPLTMQAKPEYENVVDEVFNFLESKIKIALRAGVKKIIIDPGIGFGKTLEHNLTLLKNINGKILNIDLPEERDTATALLHGLLLKDKVDIIRVHNLKTINQLKCLYNSIYS